MTFSEFGWQITQNGQLGTDHGAAGCMLFLSEGLKKQGAAQCFFSSGSLEWPGDLIYLVDFRDVYVTLLHGWLQTDHVVFESGYPNLHFV